jgi:hypothetical protein|tara:strand:+ start:7875 stop:8183 length:309 start_codon:yes stop_codon:yes gene_type:complete
MMRESEMENERDFIHPSITNGDLELMGFDENITIPIEDHWIMAHIMHSAGIFTSVGQAFKNGWNMPIPTGFWQKRVGKKKTLVSIFNQTFDGMPIFSQKNVD